VSSRPPTKHEGPFSPSSESGPGPVARAGRLAQPPFEPKPGIVVAGKYRVERVIGEGGMGIVVAATHVELDQHVAIKFLLPEAMRHGAVVERFLREAKVAAKVKSEHVARVTDVGKVEPSGVPFIVMEYLEGSDLGALIDASGRLPLDEACEIGLQACEALAEVHAAGIVHRDLKPSNLFVTRRSDGSPCLKLLDFGISKLAVGPDDDRADPALTATATIMGSPSYMSPEQLRSTKEVDGRTDVWGLGAVLYEAITGKPAFRGETVAQVCFMIGSESPVAPSTLRPDVPPGLERAILSALDKKAETRATLLELARALVEGAPPRGRASLERLEAVVGAPASKEPASRRAASLPLLTGTAVEPSTRVAREQGRPLLPHARTQSSWGEDRKRKRGGGAPLLLLALVAAAVFGVGVYTGKIDIEALRGRVSGATSAVSSVVASATEAVVSALPTAPPVPPPLDRPPAQSATSTASAPPATSASAAPSATESDPEDDAAADAPSSSPAVIAAGPPRSAPPAHLHAAPRPRHYVNKIVHRRH
jgi:serine/threonine protein kinase